MEERDSPCQVLFGSIDPRFCPHANLGPWLKYHFELDPQENEFIFSYCSLDDPIHIKERIREALNDVLRGDGFTVARVRVLGTHSVRKFAVTFARGNGCSKVRCVFILIIFMNMLIFVYYFLCFLHPFTG